MALREFSVDPLHAARDIDQRLVYGDGLQVICMYHEDGVELQRELLVSDADVSIASDGERVDHTTFGTRTESS